MTAGYIEKIGGRKGKGSNDELLFSFKNFIVIAFHNKFQTINPFYKTIAKCLLILRTFI